MFSCQYPACTECQKLPTHAVPHNAMVNGKYYCDDCRYPPCQQKIVDRVCGNRRQHRGGYNRFKPYICPQCLERKKQTTNVREEVAAPSVEMSQAPAPATPGRHEETAPQSSSNMVSPERASRDPRVAASPQAKNAVRRRCPKPQCNKNCSKDEWCSKEHFATNTGYCKECAVVCSTCKPPTLRMKAQYDKMHWENIHRQKDAERNSSCLICREAQKTEKLQCARCLENGGKRWFGRDHFHKKHLANCKSRGTWETLR